MKYVKIKLVIGVLIVQMTFSSCFKQIALNSLGIFEKKVPTKYITNGEKAIVYLPMHHIGKKEFYDHVKHVTDSLIRDGYILYLESVTPGKVTDSLQKDTLYRKARKITGVDLQSLKTNGGYLDTNKNTLNGMKIKQKLVNQPKPIPANYDSIRSKVVDATLLQLITACEEKFGPIVLEQSDFEMKPGEMQKIPFKNEKKQYFLLTFRNEFITESILKDQNKKIALMYGAKHFEGILENLQKADKNYKEVEKL
ncbi:MAG: hypothetical protein KBF74_04320 [Ferruginibacter sp.]|nr:hypothetical protein [Ferruginibacter sp.]